MIELFSVMNQLEKGALGLFFEMNYLVGVILSIYISWFIFNFERPEMLTVDELKDPANQTKYENFIKFFKKRYVTKAVGDNDDDKLAFARDKL